MTHRIGRLVGDDRIEELARGVIEPLLLQAKEADEALYDPTRWVVPPNMTAEELAQKLAEAIRQAIKEAGEAAAKEAENSVAHLSDHAKVRSSERSIGALWAADKIASAIRQRLP